MEGIQRFAFGLGVVLVALLGARLVLELFALRRAVGGYPLPPEDAASPPPPLPSHAGTAAR